MKRSLVEFCRAASFRFDWSKSSASRTAASAREQVRPDERHPPRALRRDGHAGHHHVDLARHQRVQQLGERPADDLQVYLHGCRQERCNVELDADHVARATDGVVGRLVAGHADPERAARDHAVQSLGLLRGRVSRGRKQPAGHHQAEGDDPPYSTHSFPLHLEIA